MRALPLVALLVVGCYSYRATPYRQLVPREFVRVIADSGFAMQAEHFTGRESANNCRLTRAEGTIHRVSSDTVWLAPIAFALPAAGEATLCRHISGGFFTRDAGVDLRVHANRFEARRTRNSLFWTAASLLFLAIMLTPEPETYYSG
jgi:hypothetical protein